MGKNGSFDKGLGKLGNFRIRVSSCSCKSKFLFSWVSFFIRSLKTRKTVSRKSLESPSISSA